MFHAAIYAATLVLGILLSLLGIMATIGVVVAYAQPNTSVPALVWPATVGIWLLAGACFYICRRCSRKLASRKKIAPVPLQSAYLCGECGDDSLVRGPAPDFLNWGVARCLNCDMRRKVTRDVWEQLAESNPGDPFERIDDRMDAARRQPLTLRSFAALLLIAAVAIFAAWGLDELIARLKPGRSFFWPCFIVISWGAIALWSRMSWSKRRPGRRCVQCGFDLRATTQTQCPECGTAFDPQVVRATLAAGNDPRPFLK